MKLLKTNRIVVPLLVLCTLLIACNNDDDRSNSNTQTLLTKSVTSTQTTTYAYDNENRATGFEAIFIDPIYNYTASYTYNSSGQLAEVFYDSESLSEDTKDVFFYNDSGQMTKMETYVVSGGIPTFSSKSEAVYSTPGKVSVYQTPSGGLPYLRVEYFLDANGNVLEQLAYEPAGILLVTTENSNYDDKKTSTHSLPNTGFVRNVNNYGTVTVTITGGSTSVGTFTYEYNSDGYPTKRTSNSGSIVTYEYTKR